ncbi:hypothetical protein [Ornatilinea apprima]|uniref:hypothetical protein n=1 Tax=Ornatilinea apprima TaxID=1134406 RepID=UPI0013649A6D|nr:hypothetical protein [Ornatilinea apprima]
MKKQKKIGMNGKTVTIYIPENQEDLEKLYKMQKEGKIDKTDYMHGQKKDPN